MEVQEEMIIIFKTEVQNMIVNVVIRLGLRLAF